MKLKFSGNQKMPLYLIIGATAIGVPLVLFIFIAAKERIGIAHILFLIVLTLPCVFMTARFSFVLNTIVLDKTGIRVDQERKSQKSLALVRYSAIYANPIRAERRKIYLSFLQCRVTGNTHHFRRGGMDDLLR